MAKNEAYRIAEKKIEEARSSGAKKLSLSGNYLRNQSGLDELPESLGQLTQLKSLELNHNELNELPEWLGQLTQLQTLDLSRNQLSSLPDWISQLPHLRELVAHSNQFKSLPEPLIKLSQLQVLHLGNNPLTALPEALGNLTQLRRLHVDFSHRLDSLPNSLGRMTQLSYLNASSNRLKSLPESLGQLTQLQILDLSDNQLTALPESLRELKLLKKLRLQDNPRLGLPSEIIGSIRPSSDRDSRFARGDNFTNPKHILDYYFRINEPGEGLPLNEFKLILVGRGEVGKTTLVEKLVTDKFVKFEKTPGVKITQWPKKIGRDDVRAHVWDFGGQGRTIHGEAQECAYSPDPHEGGDSVVGSAD